MMLIPDDMILAADDDHPSFPVMRDIWTRWGRGRQPWDYNKVFLQGTVKPFRRGNRLGWHGILIELSFNIPKEPDSIDIWDSSSFTYKFFLRALQTWLITEGHHTARPGTGSLVERYHPEAGIQRDPFNYGQYMILRVQLDRFNTVQDYDISEGDHQKHRRSAVERKTFPGNFRFLGKREFVA
jgi:hypothetical protein